MPVKDKPVKVNIEAKNLLAKLLASENIWIQHRQVDTAYFDMENRILTFPMWKEMSDNVYTTLAGHETSHALHTFDTVNGKRVNVSALVYAKRIDPSNLERAAMYWNIVEDARIERLIKIPYPGIKPIFAEAYKELLDADLFGIKGKNINAYPFIDRLNLHFKVGNYLTLSFIPEEEALIDEVAHTITMDDVIIVTKKIYNWSKKNELQPPAPLTVKMTKGELEKLLQDLKKQDPETSGGAFSQKIIVEITDETQQESKAGEGKGKEEKTSKPKKGKSKESVGKPKPDPKTEEKTQSGDTNEESGDGSGGEDKEGSESNGKSKVDGDEEGNGAGTEPSSDDSKSSGDENADGEKPKGSGEQPATGKEATKLVDPGPPPGPMTQSHFDKELQKLRDPTAPEIVYVTLPKPNLKNIIVDYNDVHDEIRKHFKKDHFVAATRAFETFRDAQMPIINFIVQQFEMRKQADRYKRTKQHKTGALDTLRLASYKTCDDLFKTIAICQDGKNHGLIFVVDWSSSMTSNMAGTLEQLILLCLFCRQIHIPFDVYSLTTGGNNAFSKDPGNLAYAQNFRMRTYLSSRMIPAEFIQACVNLFALMPSGRFEGGPTADNLINCTPLDESIITTIDIIKDFRRKNNAQIVNAIFLTDGGANTVSAYFNKNGTNTSMGSRYGGGNSTTRYLVDDRETHKTYSFALGDMTPTMVKILKDRNNIHAVCFYIGGTWQNFFTSKIDDMKKTIIEKQFSEDGYVISTEWGFDEMYITSRGDIWRVQNVNVRPQTAKVGTPEYMKQVEKNFKKNGHSLMKQRIMLDRFIQMIASYQKSV